jgi:uncharacterized protein (UPF0332 family)
MLEQNHIELSKIRLQKSKKCYLTAIQDARYGDYESANNRAYYSMFHAIRALLALENVDFKKHSTTIGYFNKTYIHGGHIDARFFEMVSDASDSRNKSDYNDYYTATPEEAGTNIENAHELFEAVKQYITTQFKAVNIQENLDI